MKSLTKEKRYDVIDAFNSTFGFGFWGWVWVLVASVPDLCIFFTSSYLDDLLNIDIHFEQVVPIIYPSELQLTKLMLLIPKQPFQTNTYRFIII